MIDSSLKSELDRSCRMFVRADLRFGQLSDSFRVLPDNSLNDPIHYKSRLAAVRELRDSLSGLLIAYDRHLSLLERARAEHSPLDPVDFYPLPHSPEADLSGFYHPDILRHLETAAYRLGGWADRTSDDAAAEAAYDLRDHLESRETVEAAERLERRLTAVIDWAVNQSISSV